VDRITLTGLRARGHHGVYDFERERGQEFVVDATLELDLGPAARTDDVTETVHYGELAQRLVEIITGAPVNLIETLAQRLVDQCLADPRVRAASVTVHKPGAPIPHEFADVCVTLRRTRPVPAGADHVPAEWGVGHRAVLSLGSNLGDRLANLRGAVQGLRAALAERGGAVRAVSAVYETPPWGDADQPTYLNAAVLVTNAGTPHELLRLATALEREAGRVRDPARRFGPRPLDVDIIAAWSADGVPVRVDDPALTLPHPRAHLRAFVLRPWLDVDPAAELPGHGSVADLLTRDPVRGDLASVVARLDLRLDPAT
jgi:dihydroneopterin aldolase/2-amino-4-hydroxy-6-hydroxymethyldihydropteridine diphosphokinase